MTNEAPQPTAEQIEARAKKATVGPWVAYCRDVGNPSNDPSWPVDRFLQFEVNGPAEVWGRGAFTGHDADFIAHARDDIPWLLSALRAAEARARAAEAVVEAMRRISRMHTFEEFDKWERENSTEAAIAGYEAAISIARIALAAYDAALAGKERGV